MASCCGSLWYCTPDGPVEVTADVDGNYTPPEGWDGTPPHLTEEEALEACPVVLPPAPTCSEVNPSTLPTNLNVSVTVNGGGNACSGGSGCTIVDRPDIVLTRSSPFENIWIGLYGEPCPGMGDDSMVFECSDGLYSFGWGNAGGGTCGPSGCSLLTPITGTASPFSVTFVVPVCCVCDPAVPGDLITVVISEP